MLKGVETPFSLFYLFFCLKMKTQFLVFATVTVTGTHSSPTN